YLHTTLEEIRAGEEFNVGDNLPQTQSAMDVYESVLREAGASRQRDAADRRLVQAVRDRSHRMINSQHDVGGWPERRSKTAPSDRDHDGMPDEWELARGLNPDDPADRNGDRDHDGYTNLEEYLNSLIPPH